MIVTGAAKGGSTLFSTYMVQHPKFHHAQPKELHQFSQLEDVIPHRYLKAFGYQEEGDGILSGENTPVYMFEEATMRRMAESAPFMKLILVLRHPTDRAYSEYNMYMDIEAQGQLSRDWFHSVLDELIECMDRVHRTHNNGQPGAKYEFPTDMCLGEFPKKTVTWNHLLMVRDAFRNENALPMARRGRYTRCLKAKRDFGECSLGFFNDMDFIPKDDSRYFNRGFYDKHVEWTYKHFPKEQVLILFYEDLVADPAATMQRAFEHIGLPDFAVQPRNKQETKEDISTHFSSFFMNTAWSISKKPPLEESVRQAVDKYYEKSIAGLSKYVQLPAKWSVRGKKKIAPQTEL